MCHVADKFYAAVRTLIADEPVKQRLIRAYVDHLEMLADHDVPEAVRPRFEALRKAMTVAMPTEKETAVQVTVRKMSMADASRCARSIPAMFAELVRVKNTGERLNSGDLSRVPDSARLNGGTRVPAFLAG